MTAWQPSWEHDAKPKIRLRQLIIDGYLLKETSGQISPQSDLKQRSLIGFLKMSPQQEEAQQQQQQQQQR